MKKKKIKLADKIDNGRGPRKSKYAQKHERQEAGKYSDNSPFKPIPKEEKERKPEPVKPDYSKMTRAEQLMHHRKTRNHA